MNLHDDEQLSELYKSLMKCTAVCLFQIYCFIIYKAGPRTYPGSIRGRIWGSIRGSVEEEERRAVYGQYPGQNPG